MSTRLEKVKAMVGTPCPDDEVCSIYIEIAEQALLEKIYPFVTDLSEKTVPSKYERTLLQVAVYLINKRGAEGQTYHSENGVNRTYEAADIPPSLLKNVIPYCGVRG